LTTFCAPLARNGCEPDLAARAPTEASSAEAPKPGRDSSEVAAHWAANEHLAALAAAERLAQTDGAAFAAELALAQASVGLEREALATLDARSGPSRSASSSDAALAIDATSSAAALPAIVNAARGRRIVVLNGARSAARHHAFALELARALRAEGFDTFAAEAFADIDGAVERGYPDASTANPPLDPLFGELVRTVIDLRYACVAYDAPTLGPASNNDSRARSNAREIERARTLLARVFGERPDARLLLYVEGPRLSEVWRDEGGSSEFATAVARVAKATGFDPLTIDQTIASPRSTRERDDACWRRAADSGRIASGPTVFRRPDSSWFVTGELAGQVDMQVFHPPFGLSEGRSDWLGRERASVRLPWQIVEHLDANERRLVQAFRAAESERAIPVDQFVAQPGRPLPALLLPRGEHRIVVQDERGVELARVESIVVE